MTVQATRQPGPLESAASKGLRANGNGLATRNNPQNGTRESRFSAAISSPTVLSHLQRPTHTRRVPCSGCHGEGKRAFENTILKATLRIPLFEALKDAVQSHGCGLAPATQAERWSDTLASTVALIQARATTVAAEHVSPKNLSWTDQALRLAQ